MSEPNVIQAPPQPQWMKARYPGLPDDYQVQFLNKGELHWKSNIGPQTWTLLCPYDEILIGGRRGGSKSSALIAWFAMGDPSLSDDDPAKYSYLNEPSFRGLILREEYQSMAEFIDEAHDFYRPFGVKATGGASQPVIFEFKSGAKIYTGHLGNKEAFNKSKGWGLTKIGVEELTQIPELGWYTKLFGALRNKKQFRIHRVCPNCRTVGTAAKCSRCQRANETKQFPGLRAQIMSTTNPDGVGHLWVKKRFVKVFSGDKPVAWNTPLRDQISGLTRIFIPMRLEDNPYLRDNRQYMGMLLSQDEVVRKQWMDGDWDAGVGAYFTEFRANGPIGQEKIDFPQAQHVIDSAELKPWWYRVGGGDWGWDHPAVFHKACRNEHDRRLHVYDELSVRQVGSFELGVMLAKWWMPDLEGLPDKQVTIFLSPDAFSKTDATKTKAEQIAMGMQEVLGPYGAFLLRFNDDERAAMSKDPKQAAMMFERRKQDMARGQMCIALKPANTDRIAGWSYIHELLRFRGIRTETEEQIKQSLQQVFASGGVEAYERALAQYADRKPEILPKMLIWRRCSETRRFFEEAVRDDPPRSEDVRKWDAVEGVGGDDPGDSLRHLCMGYREVETKMPKSYWLNERLEEIQRENVASFGDTISDPTRLMMIANAQAARFDKTNASMLGSFTFARASSSRHRVQ